MSSSKAFNRIALAILVSINAPATSFADKVCLRSVIKLGKIKHSTQIVNDSASCPKGFSAILTSQTMQIAGLQGPPGQQGIQGIPGIQGPPGPAGDILSSSSIVIVDTNGSTNPQNAADVKSIFGACPVGTVAIGCNAGVVDGLGVPAALPVTFSHSGPTFAGNSCFFRAYETSPVSTSWWIFGTALCAPI